MELNIEREIIDQIEFEICVRFLVQIGLLYGLLLYLSVLVDDDDLRQLRFYQYCLDWIESQNMVLTKIISCESLSMFKDWSSDHEVKLVSC